MSQTQLLPAQRNTAFGHDFGRTIEAAVGAPLPDGAGALVMMKDENGSNAFDASILDGLTLEVDSLGRRGCDFDGMMGLSISRRSRSVGNIVTMKSG